MQDNTRSGKQVLEDILFFKAQVEVEQQRIVSEILKSTQSDSGIDLQALIEAFATQLAQTNIRTQIVETILESNLKADNPIISQILNETNYKHDFNVSKSGNETAVVESEVDAQNAYADSLSLTPEDFSGLDNFYEVEFDESRGISWRWTGANPQINIPVSIDRATEKLLTIRAVQFIQPELAESLQVSIDGFTLDHTVSKEMGLWIISAVIPALPETKPSLLTITLENTYSPKQLEINNDTRVLGMSLNSVDFENA